MKFKLAKARFAALVKQRNLLYFWCTLFATISILQAIALLMKQERVVLVPPELKQHVWVEKNRVSKAYLEEMGLFFLHLALDISPSSAAFQRDMLLRYALPEQYSSLKRALLEDEQRLQKENLSTYFRPTSVLVHPSQTSIDLTGDLIGLVGDKRIFQVREIYRITLHVHKGRCFLKALQCIHSEKKPGQIPEGRAT